MRVYIAGPYSLGNVAVNVHEAMEEAHRLMDRGHMPFCPHLTHFMHIQHPRDYNDWIALDAQWLQFAQCVLRLPGQSRGADSEVKLALKLGIPVYYAIEEIPSA